MWTQLSKALGLRTRTREWGDWHTPDDAQSERYRALAALLQKFAPTAPVLDLGCGTGRFLAELPAELPYLGIDCQTDPVRIAQAQCRPHQRAICGDIGNHALHQGFPFGCIVFSEVLYYQPSTKATLKILTEYEGLIADPAIFLISIWIDRAKSMRRNVETLAQVRERYAGRIYADSYIAASMSRGWHLFAVGLHPQHRH